MVRSEYDPEADPNAVHEGETDGDSDAQVEAEMFDIQPANDEAAYLTGLPNFSRRLELVFLKRSHVCYFIAIGKPSPPGNRKSHA